MHGRYHGPVAVSSACCWTEDRRFFSVLGPPQAWDGLIPVMIAALDNNNIPPRHFVYEAMFVCDTAGPIA